MGKAPKPSHGFTHAKYPLVASQNVSEYVITIDHTNPISFVFDGQYVAILLHMKAASIILMTVLSQPKSFLIA